MQCDALGVKVAPNSARPFHPNPRFPRLEAPRVSAGLVFLGLIAGLAVLDARGLSHLDLVPECLDDGRWR